jgi:SMODS and SLOG-associating 2TM effector domain 1
MPLKLTPCQPKPLLARVDANLMRSALPPSTSLLPQFHVVGFTGHRQLADWDKARACIAEALAVLRREAPGEWIGVSSAAAGSDLVFAQTVLGAGQAWQAILPLVAAEFQKDFDPVEWQEAEALLARAETVKVMATGGVREEAYLDCGIETVNTCDVLLSLWDGEPARGRGGTAEVVAYARELGRPLIVIDPETGSVRRENFEHFKPRDAELDFLNALPETGAPNAGEPGDVRERVDRFQHKADVAASRGAPQFRLLTVSTVLLHVAATLIATAGLAFEWHPVVLPWAKLLCVLGALGAALAIRHFRAQHTWVRCRLAAEIGRAALATWGMPRRTALFQDLDLPEIRQLVRSLHILHGRGAPEKRANLDTFRQNYRARRIDDQLAYYRRRLNRAAPLLWRLRMGFVVSTVLAIICTAFYAVHHTFHLQPLPPMAEEIAFYFLPIALPVIAAAFMSLISINDLHRRVARYREMCHLLEAAHKQIVVTHTWHSLEHLVRHTERALLQEVLEWHTLMSHLESH